MVKVLELFAGVGGFRVGLEAANEVLGEAWYQVVWSNQWEPSTKVQHATEVYTHAFGHAGHTNQDIATISPAQLPAADMLVGGFPCQSYSIAVSNIHSHGIVGKRGILWWEIVRLLHGMRQRPKVLLFENVDRLLMSPGKQRGRDFAVMLASLADLGYVVEWRVINAADYGMPQRRRRVFILAYLQASPVYHQLVRTSAVNWLVQGGVLAQAFPVKQGSAVNTLDIIGDLPYVSAHHAHRFDDGGVMRGRTVTMATMTPNYTGPRKTLGDVLQPASEVPAEFYIPDAELERWRYWKSGKAEPRVTKVGHEYIYREGVMAFPDPLDKPSRTIVTAEGGRSPSRSTHVIKTEQGYRRLTPIELERLNMFPDNHTIGRIPGRRAFLMGNALVTGVVERIGVALAKAQA